MNREVISDKSAIRLIILFISGQALAIPTATVAGSDAWFSTAMATLLAVPIVLIYGRILYLFPGKDLFDIIHIIFGRFFGGLVNLIFIWFAFHVGVLVLRDVGDFVITASFPATPHIVPVIFAVLLSIWVVKHGIEVLSRWASLFFLINAPIPSIAILLLIPKMDIDNITPLFYNGAGPIIKGIFSSFTFPFAQVVIFTMVFFCLNSYKSIYKVYTRGLLMGGGLISGVALAEILVLGPDIYATTYLINHNVASKINIGDFLQRLEVLTLLAVFTANFIKASVCLLAVCNGISKIFKIKNYRIAALPIGLLMLNLSSFIHENIMEATRWTKEVGDYYGLFFEVILPVCILLVAEMKHKSLRKSAEIKS